MNITQIKKLIPQVFAIGRTPHLIGHAGTGKSSVVYQVCEELGYTVVERRLGQMADAGDLIGLMEFHKNKDGKNEYVDYVLPKWFPREDNTVIFLDEVNRSHKDLLQAIFELIYDKSLMGNKLPKNCHVIAASNPPTKDYQVLDFSDSAFQDRFVHIKFDPTFEEFMGYAKAKNFNSGVLSFLSDNQKMLRNPELEDFDLSFVKPSGRSWEAVCKLADSELEKEIFLEACMGLIGSHAAIALATYLDSPQRIPTGKEILSQYPKFKSFVLDCSANDRRDRLATIIDNVKDEVKTLDKLSQTQAQAILDLSNDLPDEYYLAMLPGLAEASALDYVEGYDDFQFKELDFWIDRAKKVKEAKENAKKKVESGNKRS